MRLENKIALITGGALYSLISFIANRSLCTLITNRALITYGALYSLSPFIANRTL